MTLVMTKMTLSWIKDVCFSIYFHIRLYTFYDRLVNNLQTETKIYIFE